jgi:F-type H+-transporting ATPase subunit gamma
VANLRVIRKRVAGVKNTKQLTRAMKMVAAAKLRRAQNRVEGGRPYMRVLQNMIGSMSSGGESLNPLSGSETACLVFVSDRGLCGSYNSNIIKEALRAYKQNPNIKFILFGRKAIEFFAKRKIPTLRTFPEFYVGFSWQSASENIQEILNACKEENVGKLDAIYTRFVSAGVQRLETKTLFPFSIESSEQEAGENKIPVEPDRLIIEPNRQQVLSALVKQYTRFSFYYVGSEAIASEHGARMSAMDLATKNAGEMIDKLTLEMNRARQANITKELLEIIGGAEAIEG